MLVISLQTQKRLEQENHLLEIQSLQYKDLKNRITESRIARHDIRHHITVLDNFVANEQYDQLHKYLANYKKSLDIDSPLVFCENETANLIIGFFAAQAKRLQVTFNANVQLPSVMKLPRPDLSVLLGNLLENAINACNAVCFSSKAVSLMIKTPNDSMMVLSIQNSYDNEPLKQSGAFFHSTTHQGLGLGLVSVKQIVDRYNGTLNITQKDGRFTVEIVLYF